jgi:hypothetical protein
VIRKKLIKNLKAFDNKNRPDLSAFCRDNKKLNVIPKNVISNPTVAQ